MSVRHLDILFAPRSVAVIGVSAKPGNVGAIVLRNLREGGFGGPVWAVNRHAGRVEGVELFDGVASLPQAPDLAVICTPPATVPELVDALGRKGTRAAIVLTAGLRDLRNEEGATLEQAMLEAARPHLLRILGPNCIGALVPGRQLNASFAPGTALPGPIAFVTQSGALATAMLDWANAQGIGFSHFVSLGDSADVDFGDVLDWLASDAGTRAILMYVESVKHARKFMSAARAAARNKPVIVVKAGRAGQGLKAAASHTGALAGSDAVFDAAIRRAGMLRVDTLQDLFMAAETLARFSDNRDDALTLMTNGGGAGVMAADAAALAGIPLRELGAATRDRLDAALPATWSRANPIDIIGDAPVQRYVDTLQALIADRDSGALLFLHSPTAIVRSDDIARACVPLVRQAPGRVMACWLGDAAVADARRIFEEAGVAQYATPEEAVRAFGMLRTYRGNQALLTEAPAAREHPAPDTASARGVVDGALAAGRDMLDELEAKALLRAYGIPVVPTVEVGASADAAAAAARECGFPAVLKILSPDISHKSDVGGVRLNLRDAGEVERAAVDMLERVRRLRPQAALRGFTVQAMVQRPMAQELIVGASVDAVFGPVVLFGQGGTAVEVLADRAIALPPLNSALARELVSRTRVAKLLAGYRDHPPARADALHDVLVAVSQMLADLPELAELDINPLWADDRGVVALDARVRLSRTAGAGADRFAILPYPAELAETVDWRGGALVLRPIRPEDEAEHLAFIERLAPEDVRLRFFSPRRQLPRSELARLVQIDYAREMAFVALATRADGSTETLGVVRAVADPDNVEAEFAIIVRSDVKGQGIGHLLLGKLIRYLRGHGTQRMVGEVLRDNRAMHELARAHGLRADPLQPEGEAQRYVLALQGAA